MRKQLLNNAGYYAGRLSLLLLTLLIGRTESSKAQVLLSEDFTAQALPPGWDTVSVTNDGNWAFNNPGSRIISNGPDANFDAGFAIFDSDNWCGSNEDAELITAAFDASAAGSVILSFDNSFRNWGVQEGHVEVWNGTAWVGVLTLSGGDDGYSAANRKVVDITAATGGSPAARVRFHWMVGSCDYWWAVDNVLIENVSCYYPSGLNLDGVGQQTAEISWTPPGGAPSAGYEYYYNTTGVPPTAATTASGTVASGNSASLSGLAPNTAYFIWLRSVCGVSEKSDWTPQLTFHTLATPATLPWSEDFTTGGSDWILSNGSSSNRWHIGGATGNSGNSLYISDDNGTSNEYATGSSAVVHAHRDIDLPSGLHAFNLNFDWKCKGEGFSTTNYDYFRVWLVPVTFAPSPGTQITASASGGLQLGGNLNNADSWQAQNFVIPDSFAGSLVRLVFEWRNDGSFGTQPPAALDNIQVSILSCAAGGMPVADSLAVNHAVIAWAPASPSPANGYDFYYDTASTPPTAATLASGSTTDTFTHLPGLAANTTYYAWVRSDCGAGNGTSDWIGPVIVTTLPGVQIPATLPWSEDFTSGGTDWTILNGAEANRWAVGTATGNTGNSLYISEDNGANNTYDNGAGAVVFAYRDIRIPAGTTDVSLAFDWKAVGESNWDYLRLWVIGNDQMPTPGTQITGSNPTGALQLGGTGNGGNFNVLRGGTASAWNSEYLMLDATAVAGDTIRLVLEWRNDGSDGNQPPAAIDNISVREITCMPPVQIVYGTVGFDQVTLSWNAPGTAPGTGYDYYHATTPAAPTPATAPTGSFGPAAVSGTISGLTGSTTYYLWMRSDCGSGDRSVWVFVDSFTTACLPLVAPWSDDVENHTATTTGQIQACWSTSPAGSSSIYGWNVDASGSTGSSGTGPSGAFSGSKFFYVEASYGAVGDAAYLYLPQIDASALTTPALSFYYHMFGSDMGDLFVERFDGTNWVALDSIEGEQQTALADPWRKRVVVINGGSDTLALRFRALNAGTYEGDISLDDIAVTEAPTCFPPTNLSTATVTDVSAEILWDASSPAPANGYDYYYNTSGTPPDAVTSPSGSVGAGVLTTTLNGLTPDVSYYFWVRSRCSSTDLSDWSAVGTFMTPCATVVPPYQEDFDASVPTDCWSESRGALGATVVFNGTASDWTQQSWLSSSATDKAAYINLYSNSRQDWLISPAFDLGTSGNYVLEFDLAILAWTGWTDQVLGSDDTLAVVISTDGGATWSNSNVLDRWTAANTPVTGGTHISIPLSNYTGVVKIGFYGSEGLSDDPQDNRIQINNFEISACTPPVVTAMPGSHCGPGAVNLSASAPGSGVTYAWFDVATGGSAIATGASFTSPAINSSTTYYVQASENGCASDRMAVEATIYALPVADLGPDTAFCEGGSLTLDATLSGSGYTYEWDNNSSQATRVVNAGGSYSVRVTDNNQCADSDTVVVTVHPLPVVALGADTTICADVPLLLDAGNTGSDYIWSDGTTAQTLSVDAAGNYWVEVTDGATGCMGSDTIDVFEENPVAIAGIDMTADDGNGTYGFIASGLEFALGVYWDFGDGGTATGTQVSHRYETEGVYTVTATAVGDCGDSVTVVMTVEFTVGIHDIPEARYLVIYPNPSSSVFNVEIARAASMRSLTLYNVLGQQVYTAQADTGKRHALSTSGLASGIYTLKIETDKGVILRKVEVLR